jgi:hypothetical protein
MVKYDVDYIIYIAAADDDDINQDCAGEDDMLILICLIF